jgi:hypothetical protein
VTDLRYPDVELEAADLAVRLDPFYAPLRARFAELLLQLLEERGGGRVADVLDRAAEIMFGSATVAPAIVLVRLFLEDINANGGGRRQRIDVYVTHVRRDVP